MRKGPPSGRADPRGRRLCIRLLLAILAATIVGPHYTASTTCYAQGGITASGQQARFGEVANDWLALGTRIVLDRPAFGRRRFVVEDRIGSGSELDVFYPSESACLVFGRQTRGFRVV